MGLNSLKVNQRFNPVQDDKRCPFCLNVDEDEHHFISICSKYDDLREKYLTGFFNLEIQTVAELLQTQDVTCIRQLAMYIHYGLARRDQIMKN